MKLIQIVGDLASFNTDDTESTIYASEPWTTDCEGIVAPESELATICDLAVTSLMGKA